MEQICKRDAGDTNDVTIGLDFGTSSVKVVIGDASIEKAFAVPFCNAPDVEAFLLPTRLYESTVDEQAGHKTVSYSLHAGAVVHSDLKLSLMANPESARCRTHVIALLALIIRNARAWLFEEHESIYRRTNIVWRVAIGLPAASSLNNELVPIFRNMVKAAWKVAGGEDDVEREAIDHFYQSLETGQNPVDEIEVDVVPELAAQIYGFVVSHSFDKKKQNRYLMVDVGAGTVDSSLFLVKPARGGRWDFELYTAVVRPNGVANLHSHRVGWWNSVLDGVEKAVSLKNDLLAIKFATDMEVALPEKYTDYFSGIEVTHTGKIESPDRLFFRKRLMTQVRGSTLWGAWNNGFLLQNQLTGIPMFLCGGGARMPFYKETEKQISNWPGYSWLKATPWQLGIPKDLECEAVRREDYDRLSVAYGLSKIHVGELAKASPMHVGIPAPDETWRERYIDKDQC